MYSIQIKDSFSLFAKCARSRKLNGSFGLLTLHRRDLSGRDAFYLLFSIELFNTYVQKDFLFVVCIKHELTTEREPSFEMCFVHIPVEITLNHC